MRLLAHFSGKAVAKVLRLCCERMTIYQSIGGEFRSRAGRFVCACGTTYFGFNHVMQSGFRDALALGICAIAWWKLAFFS